MKPLEPLESLELLESQGLEIPRKLGRNFKTLLPVYTLSFYFKDFGRPLAPFLLNSDFILLKYCLGFPLKIMFRPLLKLFVTFLLLSVRLSFNSFLKLFIIIYPPFY